LVPSFDGCDDFVGVLGPGKGLWVCIDVVEEVVDGVFEFLEGSEHAALEALFGEFGKETWTVFFLGTLTSITVRKRMNS
jgi:hypothetical protein